MLDTKVIALFLFVPSLFSVFHLWSACHSLYSKKRSKTAQRKIGRTMTPWHKFLLLYPLKAGSPNCRKIRRLRKLYYFELFVILLCVIAFLFTVLFDLNNRILFCCVAVKVVLLEIPIETFSFIMTKHGKNGGVVWRWED